MNITIDGQVYDLNTLSEEAKAHIGSLQAAEIRLNELKRDAAMIGTARNIYAQALKKELAKFQPQAQNETSEVQLTQPSNGKADKPKSRSKSSNSEA